MLWDIFQTLLFCCSLVNWSIKCTRENICREKYSVPLPFLLSRHLLVLEPNNVTNTSCCAHTKQSRKKGRKNWPNNMKITWEKSRPAFSSSNTSSLERKRKKVWGITLLTMIYLDPNLRYFDQKKLTFFSIYGRKFKFYIFRLRNVRHFIDHSIYKSFVNLLATLMFPMD